MLYPRVPNRYAPNETNVHNGNYFVSNLMKDRMKKREGRTRGMICWSGSGSGRMFRVRIVQIEVNAIK